MEELDGDLENLIIIQFHHHEHVLEASVTDLDALVVSIDGDFEPGVLGFEEFGVEIGDTSGEDFKNVSVLFLDRFEHLLEGLVII